MVFIGFVIHGGFLGFTVMVSFGIKFVIMLRRISVKVSACQFGSEFLFRTSDHGKQDIQRGIRVIFALS